MIEAQWRKLGKALEQNAEALSQLYTVLDEEVLLEKTGTSWGYLVEHGLVHGNPTVGYSPSPLLLKLGDVLALVKNRQAQAPDIAEWMEDARRLVDRYHEAKTGNDEAGFDSVRRELYSTVLTLQSTLIEESNQLEYYLDNQFGHVNSLRAKRRENEYCTQRARRYVDKLTLLNAAELGHLCGNEPELARLFFRKLLPNVQACRSRMLAAIPRLEKMLWAYRRTDTRTRLVRAMSNYFQAGRRLETDALSDTELREGPFNVVASETLCTEADVWDADNRAALIAVVESLPPPKDVGEELPEPPERGPRTVDVAAAEQAALPVSELQPLLLKFTEQVKTGESSARAFWQAQGLAEVPSGVWLCWLHHELLKANAALRTVRLDIVAVADAAPGFVGNQTITDLNVSFRRVSE
ncbi:MAG: hypothetical protein J5I92_15110 [Thiogranum sp.]|nr:hypothetical protein [Thiogranum sp.]